MTCYHDCDDNYESIGGKPMNKKMKLINEVLF